MNVYMLIKSSVAYILDVDPPPRDSTDTLKIKNPGKYTNGNAGEPRGNHCLAPSTGGASARVILPETFFEIVCKILQPVHFWAEMVRNAVNIMRS